MNKQEFESKMREYFPITVYSDSDMKNVCDVCEEISRILHERAEVDNPEPYTLSNVGLKKDGSTVYTLIATEEFMQMPFMINVDVYSHGNENLNVREFALIVVDRYKKYYEELISLLNLCDLLEAGHIGVAFRSRGIPNDTFEMRLFPEDHSDVDLTGWFEVTSDDLERLDDLEMRFENAYDAFLKNEDYPIRVPFTGDKELIPAFDDIKHLLRSCVLNESVFKNNSNNYYIHFKGMALCLYIEAKYPSYTKYVTTDMVREWGISENVLLHYAQTNDLSRMKVKPLSQVAGEIGLHEDEDFDDFPMYMIGNKAGCSSHLGACYLANPNALSAICERYNENYIYLTPSSIHELLFIKGSFVRMSGMSEEDFAKEQNSMIEEINATEVSPNEVLFNKCFKFDNLTKELSILG